MELHACVCRRQIHGEKEDDVAVPPLFKTALVWGLFMGVSSNLRYQVSCAVDDVIDVHSCCLAVCLQERRQLLLLFSQENNTPFVVKMCIAAVLQLLAQ